MDLGAYANIENLDELARKNGIYCPRLRGYRLMKDEESVNAEEVIAENNIEYYCARDLCRTIPFWCPSSDTSEFSLATDLKVKRYTDENSKTIRWDRIHGWKRRTLKTYIHNTVARYKKQYAVWNKYAGQESVLYIHARIGGGNWPYYYKEVVNQPWFIEKVDDAFDSTYCDIYARINV